MPEIILKNVTKRYGDFYAVENINLTIPDDSFITLLGPSGCGKTTTLRMIAGLETPTTGKITINGETVFDSDAGINVSANKRHVGFLFQNYALWPHMTVYKNIQFGLANVDQVMPVHASEYERLLRMQKVVVEKEKLAGCFKSSLDKKGKIEPKKALLNLIDTFEISMYSAKELFQALANKNVAVWQPILDQLGDEYKKMAEENLQKLESKGFEVNDKFDLVQNKQVVAKKRHLDKEEIDLRIRRVARIVKVGEFMDRYPNELSGGQQQRVAIARTLAPGPKVLFMDEPLSNLDAKLRLEMRSELKRLHHDTGATFIYVTHDQLEAMTLATRICLINNGVVQQYDAPLDVYKHPNNLFVADFVGNPAINLIEAKAKQDKEGIHLSLFGSQVKATFIPNTYVDLAQFRKEMDQETQAKKAEYEKKLKQKSFVVKGNADKPFNFHILTINGNLDSKDEKDIQNDDYVIGIRPEFMRIEDDGKLETDVYSAMPSGMETTVKLRVGEFIITSVVFGGVDYKVNAKAKVNIIGKEILLFDRKTQKLIAAGELKLE
ncbi:MAG: ABC transporter ATP-binding protein [Bacilli bacterium]|jgi:ABC-type sugar transport system ATPase subunit|nr:ABC transporter ATP-binding protein [Bacilli bacterium]